LIRLPRLSLFSQILHRLTNKFPVESFYSIFGLISFSLSLRLILCLSSCMPSDTETSVQTEDLCLGSLLGPQNCLLYLPLHKLAQNSFSFSGFAVHAMGQCFQSSTLLRSVDSNMTTTCQNSPMAVNCTRTSEPATNVPQSDTKYTGVRIPGGAGNFSLRHRVQTGCEDHPAPYPTGATDSFPGGIAAGA